MKDCLRAETCSFFAEQMKNMPSIAALFRRHFCHGTYYGCARYHLCNYMIEKDYVVSDEIEAKIADLSVTLFPDELARVRSFFQNIDSNKAY